MDNKNLYEQFGNIKEEFVTEARTYKRTFNYKKYLAIAASFVVVLACVMVFKPNNVPIVPSSTTSPTPTTTPLISEESSNPTVTEPPQDKVYDLTINEATGMVSANKIFIEGHFWNELTEDEINSIFNSLVEYNLTARADYSKVDDTINLYEVNAYFKIDDTNITLTVNDKKIISDCFFEGDFVASNIECIEVFAKKYETASEIIYVADFQIDDIFYRVQFAGDESDEKYLSEIVSKIILSEKADFSALKPIPPEKLLDEQLSLEEAYKDNDFGKFIPKSFPQNFTFESANRFINQESDYLNIWFSSGMDDYSVNIRNLTENDKKRITSVEDTENYDLNLYPIPTFESVPKELREIVDNPIFKIEELSLEVLKMRSYNVEDIGDTNGERMRFSVLYGDVLIEIRSKGLTSSQVYDMLMTVE